MLEETQLFVLDMDGTFFMGQSVIEGALDFIEEVKRRKKKFLFFTNNSRDQAVLLIGVRL